MIDKPPNPYKSDNGFAYYTAPLLESFDNLQHFFGTRKGGYSSKPSLATMNISFSVGDREDIVQKNRTALAQSLRIQAGQLIFMDQTHSSRIFTVNKNAPKKSELQGVDGLITQTPGRMLTVQTADCAPVMFYDPEHHAVGAAHAGWRGSVNGILYNLVHQMQRQFYTDPQKLYVAIGPSIGPGSYEIGQDVKDAADAYFSKDVADKLFTEKENGKYLYNLWDANKQQLLMAGLKQEHIYIMGICSYLNPLRFFSARFRKFSGRQASGIMLT